MATLGLVLFLIAFVLLVIGEVRQNRSLRIAGIVLLTPGVLVAVFVALFMSMYAG